MTYIYIYIWFGKQFLIAFVTYVNSIPNCLKGFNEEKHILKGSIMDRQTVYSS